MLLLRVQAGSRLYGYATELSDDDYFEVHTEPFMIDTRDEPRRVRQTIVDGIDTTQMTLSTFIERASMGSHQALDAMFAAEPLFDMLNGLRNSFYAGSEVISTYERIITKFAIQEGFRKQRHALRTVFNLTDILETGRYSPELSDERIALINSYAILPYSQFREVLIRLSPIDLMSKLPEKV